MIRTMPFVVLLLAGGCSTATLEDEPEIEIDIAGVPAHVLEAVQEALPGFEVTGAELETQTIQVYELDGELNGKTYEIELTEDGIVLEVEEEDEEEEGEAEDED